MLPVSFLQSDLNVWSICVDLDTGLIYEGLDNFILLTHIEELNLSRNIKLDDWACDKLARIFRNSKSLEYLDLSDMPLVTHRGIEVMYKIRSLKTLVIRGTRAAQFPFIELLNLMLKDVNPNCEIIYKWLQRLQQFYCFRCLESFAFQSWVFFIYKPTDGNS